MKTLPLATALLLTALIASAQEDIDVFSDEFGFDEIVITLFSPMLPSDDEIKGPRYLDENWASGTLTVALGTHRQDISFDMIRYHIENDLVEVYHEDQILGAEGKAVKRMDITDFSTGDKRSFIRLEDIETYSSEDKTGMCELLADGDVKLIRTFDVEIQEANYDAALDVGEKEDKMIILSQTYLVKGGLFIKVKGKGDLISLLDDVDIKGYMKKNKLSHKNESDLAQIIDYYNKEIN
ncbi:MAG: hypothetical protein RJQ09_20570 [Cyclobacteriaceae bacterium]